MELNLLIWFVVSPLILISMLKFVASLTKEPPKFQPINVVNLATAERHVEAGKFCLPTFALCEMSG